jgi:hypothetical protein
VKLFLWSRKLIDNRNQPARECERESKAEPSHEYIILDFINKHFYDLPKARVIIFYGVIRFMSFFFARLLEALTEFLARCSEHKKSSFRVFGEIKFPQSLIV